MQVEQVVLRRKRRKKKRGRPPRPKPAPVAAPTGLRISVKFGGGERSTGQTSTPGETSRVRTIAHFHL